MRGNVLESSMSANHFGTSGFGASCAQATPAVAIAARHAKTAAKCRTVARVAMLNFRAGWGILPARTGSFAIERATPAHFGHRRLVAAARRMVHGSGSRRGTERRMASGKAVVASHRHSCATLSGSNAANKPIFVARISSAR
jgi:hypothetical protein